MQARAWWLLALGIAGCADSPLARERGTAAAVSAGSLAEVRAAQAGRTSRGFEDEILRLEGKVPGLGGISRDAAGQLVLYLRDERDRGNALRELRAAGPTLRVDPDLRRQMIAGDRVVIRRGDYGFSQLVDWQRAILGRVRGESWLIGVDADEGSNRVRVYVREGTSPLAVESRIEAAGIPVGAIVIEYSEPLLALGSLQGTFLPTGGGVQITHDGSGACTLGFNVTTYAWNETALLTAAHCVAGSPFVGSTGGTVRQPTSAGTALGTVTINPAFNRTDSECGSFTACTDADVMMVTYTNQYNSEKRVARTASVGTNNNVGSLNQVGWWTDIEKAWFYPYAGMGIDKVGRTTGWTRGSVTATCVAADIGAYSYGSYRVLCADLVSGAAVGAGDSGSPMFYPPVGGDPLWALGILFAGGPLNQNGVCTSNCTIVYSPWYVVDSHLTRYFNYTPPPPPPPPKWASIYGTDMMRPTDYCTWMAQSDVSEPRFYQWSVSGSVIGTADQVTYNTGASFTLELQVWNSLGEGASAYKSVNVSSENSPCYDM